MPQVSVCPDVSSYRQLLSGTSLPDGEALLGHLETCADCQRTVRSLDEFVLNVSPNVASTPDSAERRQVESIVRRCRDQSIRDTSLSTLSGGERPQLASAALEPILAQFLSAPQAPDEIGRLAGYRVLRVLGKGGMGVVFEAEDVKLGRRVALKVMKPEIAHAPQYRERFLREARTVARVESDHVCPIF